MNTVKRQPGLRQISVIVPVKNEEASIRQLLQGLDAQLYQPAEIVITDGGSTDLTREIIRDWQSCSPLPVVLIETDDALPGRGRNLAIARATQEWIASIDSGTCPRKDWLSQLVAVAERVPQAEVIYGVAEPLTDTYFTECAAISYLPEGRMTQSIASCLMRRSAWQKAGGFREDLRSSEDLLLFERLDAAGVLAVKCPDAVVIWELQPTIASTFRRFVSYSRNSMKAGLGRQWQYNVSRLYLLMLVPLLSALWFRPLLLVPPAILLLRAEKRVLSWYRAQSARSVWRKMFNPRRVLTVAVLNLVIDFATFCGMWQWFVHDRSKPAKPLMPERS